MTREQPEDTDRAPGFERLHAPVLLLLLAFAVWCVGLMTSVHGLRRDLTQRVGWLTAIQAVGEDLEPGAAAGDELLEAALGRLVELQVQWIRAGEPIQRPAARVGELITTLRDRLAQHGAASAQVMIIRSQLASALRDETAVIRQDSGRISHALGSHWSALYAIAVIALALAIANSALLLKLARQSRRIHVANRELEWRSMRDPLTGLLNRRAILERVEEALADRPGSPVALLMADLDDFNSVNLTLGYEAGDELLRISARRLRASVRGGDIIGRYGGEDFLVVLPGCEEASAALVAERVREMFDVDLRLGSALLRRTISVGVAVGASPAEARALLSLADAALREAKRRGRNQVEVREHVPAQVDGAEIEAPGLLTLAAAPAQRISAEG